LKLLREGSTNGGKKKPARPQNKANVGRFSADGISVSDAAQSCTSQPITTSSLAKKWSSVLNKLSDQNDDITADAEMQVRTTQDDIGIEKLLLDQDLSDPAYYSDSESVIAKPSASMHRLGRRPKASTAAIRTYVMQDLNFLLDQAVGMLLLRLQNFMNAQRMFAPCDAISEQRAQQYTQRRFVIGLKEVSRRTRQSKVECLIVAPDIEEDANSGGLDDRMRELLASAYQNQTPVVFALSRARLGKALGKSLHISVLGVLDSTGARSLLDESLLLADKCRQAWLARLQK
jgi:ribosomal protein L7Ae-like RNA K-turn-binding protein